jgi:hypothetical protein
MPINVMPIESYILYTPYKVAFLLRAVPIERAELTLSTSSLRSARPATPVRLVRSRLSAHASRAARYPVVSQNMPVPRALIGFEAWRSLCHGAAAYERAHFPACACCFLTAVF